MKNLREWFQQIGQATNSTAMTEINPQLADMERVFRAPPMTPELLAAIKLISPQFEFTASEKSRLVWEADQNGACWGEYEALTPLFRSIPKPDKILEIGPGMGRSLVFFIKKLGWENSKVHAYEGEGNTTKYTNLGPRFDDSYCGNLEALRHVLNFNRISNVTMFNAQNIGMKDLPGPYDLLYSFYSIGFHWALEYFLDDLLSLMHERSVAIFTVPQEFEIFSALDNLHHRIIDWRTAWPKNGQLKLLILSKSALPV